MAGVKIKFPDGSVKEFKKGITGAEIATTIGQRLAKAALAVKLDGELKDLNSKIEKDAKIEIVTFDSKEGKAVFWHSAGHLMTQAVLRVFKNPKIGLGVGPAIENGFYQDFDMKPLNPGDLEKIEKEMKKIVSEKLEIKQRDISKKESLRFYKHDPYKTEMARDVPGDSVSMYKQGEFDNLCKGPHVPNTSYIKAFKLTKVSGAYWRGDAKNKMLQRIYGVAFPKEQMLKDYLHLLEEAEKRNHLKLGKQLDLFSMQDDAPGCVFFHPKGMVIVNELLGFVRKELLKRGYVEVSTPIILKQKLWKQSGHWEHYRNNMYFTKIDDEDYAIKPMNCPGGILIYKTKRHSYRDFPIRMGEWGIVHRHELSGVLQGLFRVRKFTQDDAHIFCLPSQLKDELKKLIDLVGFVYNKIGFKDYHVELSTKPEGAMGDEKIWEQAESNLKEVLEEENIKYQINKGEGVFYGPKIDFHIKDSLGRTWQCATLQLDFLMPEKFDLFYIGEDDKPHRPIMLHRTILGSTERFLGILTEHYAGAFPLWLSPVQVKVISVSDKYNKYAEGIYKKLFDAGIRVERDFRTETVSYKIRQAQLEKVNYAIVVGEKEEKNKTVTVRNRAGKLYPGMKIADFLKKLLREIREKK